MERRCAKCSQACYNIEVNNVDFNIVTIEAARAIYRGWPIVYWQTVAQTGFERSAFG